LNTDEKPKGKFATVSLPTPLFRKIEERIQGTDFTSVSSYVIYVLREIITNDDDKSEDTPFSKEDEDKVKDRLKALGYLE
jgi:Arc/MetJ-type ribon-helix-helix transcriptional regulator